MMPERYYSMMSKTLCWSCQKACGGCSWSKQLVPVEGWQAIRRDIHNNVVGADMESYRVIVCPQYVEDEPRE